MGMQTAWHSPTKTHVTPTHAWSACVWVWDDTCGGGAQGTITTITTDQFIYLFYGGSDVEAAAYSPVHCVEHFYNHKHRKRHSHGFRMNEDGAVYALEATLLSQALRLMSLVGKEHDGIENMRVQTEGYLFMAFSISTTTKTDSAMVMGFGFSKIRQSMPWKLSCSAKHCMWCVCVGVIATLLRKNPA